MQKMTIKAYAVKHKLSIFNVMKMVKSGKVDSETVFENGKESLYIVLNKEKEKEIKASIVPLEDGNTNSLKSEVYKLKLEVKALRDEITLIKKRLDER